MQLFFLVLSSNLSEKINIKYIPQNNMRFILSQKLNILNPEYQIKELSDELFISERQLSRLIKKYYNMTFVERKNYLRTENAKNLLLTTKLSIDEISEKLGYSDRNSFTFSFKKITGLSPAEYRKNNLHLNV